MSPNLMKNSSFPGGRWKSTILGSPHRAQLRRLIHTSKLKLSRQNHTDLKQSTSLENHWILCPQLFVVVKECSQDWGLIPFQWAGNNVFCFVILLFSSEDLITISNVSPGCTMTYERFLSHLLLQGCKNFQILGRVEFWEPYMQ